MRGIHLLSRRVRCYQHGHLHTQRYKAASLYLNKTYTLSAFSSHTKRPLFERCNLYLTLFWASARSHMHAQCENGSRPTWRQLSQSSLTVLPGMSAPGSGRQRQRSEVCVTLTSELRCPAADINNWHISHIFPSLNSLQERNGVWRKRERNICTLRFQDNRSYVLST